MIANHGLEHAGLCEAIGGRGERLAVEALLDGLREFPPNGVVLVPGSERGWGDAGALVARVRRGSSG